MFVFSVRFVDVIMKLLCMFLRIVPMHVYFGQILLCLNLLLLQIIIVYSSGSMRFDDKQARRFSNCLLFHAGPFGQTEISRCTSGLHMMLRNRYSLYNSFWIDSEKLGWRFLGPRPPDDDSVWRPPARGWYKLNFDASISKNLTMAG